MSMKKILLFLCVLVSMNCFSSTFYIRTDGSNSNTGTTNSAGGAWLTWQYASTHTTSGDIVYGTAGTWPAGVNIDGVGVTCIIQSTATTEFTPLMNMNSNSGTNGNQYVRNVKFDGRSRATSWGIVCRGRNNVSFYNLTIIDFDDRGLIIDGRFPAYDTEPVIADFGTGNTVHDNIITNCAKYDGYGRGCLNVGAQKGMLIYNNTITQLGRTDGTNGWPIKYQDNGYLKGCKIYNNTLNKAPLTNTQETAGQYDFAIEFFNETGLEIYNNTIVGGGIDLNHQPLFMNGDTYTYSAWIHDNSIYNIVPNAFRQAGITLEYGTNTAIIERNTVDNQSIGAYFTPRNGDTVQNLIIKNNLFTIVEGESGGAYIDFGGSPVGDLQYNLNNTVKFNTMLYKTGRESFFGIIMPRAATGKVNNLTIINNIMSGCNFYVVTQPSNAAVVPDRLTINYNCLYLNANSNGFNFAGGGSGTNYGSTAANITSNPLWTNQAGGIYTLQGGSPCINTASDGTDRGYTGGGGAVMTITTSSPANAATGVLTTVHPTITFSETIDASTVTGNITLTQAGVPKTLGFSTVGSVVTITPTSDLSYSLPYVITVGTGVLAESGNALISPATITFTTTAAPTNTIITQYLIIYKRR